MNKKLKFILVILITVILLCLFYSDFIRQKTSEIFSSSRGAEDSNADLVELVRVITVIDGLICRINEG